MLFPRAVLDGIAAGSITLAFRRGARPPARPGGTLLTSVGQIAFDSVTVIEPDAITPEDAHRAGFPDRDALLHMLTRGTGR